MSKNIFTSLIYYCIIFRTTQKLLVFGSELTDTLGATINIELLEDRSIIAGRRERVRSCTRSSGQFIVMTRRVGPVVNVMITEVLQVVLDY